MPVEILPRDSYQSSDSNAMQTCRLSSFGYSGTIAHGAFGIKGTSVMSDRTRDSKSLYRSRHPAGLGRNIRYWLSWLVEMPGPKQSYSSLDDVVVGTLAPLVQDSFSHHVIAGSIFLPGTGYVEMAFAANQSQYNVLQGVAVTRPCVLPVPGFESNWKCILRCTRRGTGLFEISSYKLEGKQDSNL